MGSPQGLQAVLQDHLNTHRHANIKVTLHGYCYLHLINVIAKDPQLTKLHSRNSSDSLTTEAASPLSLVARLLGTQQPVPKGKSTFYPHQWLTPALGIGS